MTSSSARLAIVVNAQTGAAVSSINKLGGAARLSSKDLKTLGDGGKSAGDRIQGGLIRAGQGIAAVGKLAGGASLAIGAAAVLVGKSIVDIGVQFQNQLNTLQAVTHSTDATMAKVATRARDLGNDLDLPATSAADAAAAMTELAKGNLTAQQAMDAAKGTLLLSAAAQIDGATAAGIQANALNAFSLKASQAGHVADVLANAANSATGEIGDFALGLQASSAVAAQFGISLDDTVTALALFANKGIRGSDAGTSLKSALLALASPSAKAAGALKALHLSAFDAQGNFVGLAKISDELATAQKHMSQEAFAAAVSTAFGSDAARAAGVLAAYGADGFDKMAAAVSRSGGAADVAKSQMKGVGGAIQGLQSQIETVKIDIFQRAAPSLESFIRALSDRMPAAADATLRGIDRFAGFVQSEFPHVRDEFAKVAPTLEKQVTAKIELAGQAANNVLAPALRGVGTVVEGILPHVQELGDTFGQVVRAGIDAGSRAAHGFEAEARNVGEALGGIAHSAAVAGQQALPVLKVALTGVADAAGVALTALTGAAATLAPLAGYAGLAVAGITGVKLAISGFGSAKGTIGKLTSSFGQMADRASYTAGIVTQKVGVALGKDLNAAAGAGATAMAATRLAFTGLGASAIIATAAVLAHGYTQQQNAQQAQRTAAASANLYDQVRQGGNAAVEAGEKINQYSGALAAAGQAGGLTANLAGKVGEAFERGKVASDDAYNALSPLQRASVDVTKAQNDLSAVLGDSGASTNDVTNASNRLNLALAAQKSAQDSVTGATAASTQTLSDYTNQLLGAAAAQAGAASQDISAKQSILSLISAQAVANDETKRYGANSLQARQARLSLQQAEATARTQILASAAAARDSAIANDRSGNAAEAAAHGADAQREELRKLAATLAPGSALRKQLLGYIAELDRAARDRTTHIRVQVQTAVVQSGVALPGNQGARPNVRAAGGPVTRGRPYIVGEKHSELFIPNEDGFIYPSVPGSVRDNVGGGVGSGRGSNVYNITVNVPAGAHPADVGASTVKAIQAYERRSGTAWRAA